MMIELFDLTSNAYPLAAFWAAICSTFFIHLFSKNTPLFGAVHREANKYTLHLKHLIPNTNFSGDALPGNV